MKNFRKPLILLLAASTILLFVVVLRQNSEKFGVVSPKIVQEIQTTLSVNNGSSVKSFDASGFVGKTALDATQADTKVVTSGTGVNAFVTSINGRSADPKKHEFWELDANGSETQVGAGSYYIKNGDSILWKLNTY
jgi:hypothetical protein